MGVRKGLSSIGGIFNKDDAEAIELLCESLKERPVQEPAITVALPDEAKELRLIAPGFGSFLSAKVSRSNLSASSNVMGCVLGGELETPDSDVVPLRYGTSILDSTS